MATIRATTANTASGINMPASMVNSPWDPAGYFGPWRLSASPHAGWPWLFRSPARTLSSSAGVPFPGCASPGALATPSRATCANTRWRLWLRSSARPNRPNNRNQKGKGYSFHVCLLSPARTRSRRDKPQTFLGNESLRYPLLLSCPLRHPLAGLGFFNLQFQFLYLALVLHFPDTHLLFPDTHFLVRLQLPLARLVPEHDGDDGHDHQHPRNRNQYIDCIRRERDIKK